MARSAAKKYRGVYEYPPGSDVWWIQYFVDGRRRREKVGGKQAAINRYQQRKTEAREGRLPTAQHHVPFDSFVTEYLEGERLRLRAFAEYERHGRVWDRPLRPSSAAPHPATRHSNVGDSASGGGRAGHGELGAVLPPPRLQRALANGLVERNPVKAVRFFHEPSGRVRFRTDDEEPCL